MEPIRSRLYESYASTHAGCHGTAASALVYRRVIRPRLPVETRGRILDIGCGQGELVQLLAGDGFDAEGVDASPEQVAIAHTAGRNPVHLGDFRDHLHAAPAAWDAIIATDVLEHLTKSELLSTFADIHNALKPGGVLIGRVPNGTSPLSGQIMYGDITHETCFTGHSLAQLAAVTGFASIEAFDCPPLVHGVKSLARAAVWKPISGLLKLALATHTGQIRGHITTPNLGFAARRAASGHPQVTTQSAVTGGGLQ